jgi:hypothetical protein
MAMLSLLEIYCDGISDLLYLSINILGRDNDHGYRRLRSEALGYTDTRLPDESEHGVGEPKKRDCRKTGGIDVT